MFKIPVSLGGKVGEISAITVDSDRNIYVATANDYGGSVDNLVALKRDGDHYSQQPDIYGVIGSVNPGALVSQ